MSDLVNTYYLSSVVMEYEGDHAKIVKAVRESMAFHHGFDPKDQRAIFVFDVFADLMDLQVISDFASSASPGLHRTAHSGHRRRRAHEHHAGVSHAAHA